MVVSRLMTPEEIDAWAEEMRQAARENFERDGRHRAVTLVLATVDPRTQTPCEIPMMIPVIADDFDNRTKGPYAQFVRALCKDSKALAVIFVSEVWMTPLKSEAEIERVRKLETIEHEPDRTEKLMITYERKGHAYSHVWMAEITRVNEKPVLAEYVELTADPNYRTKGRFVDMLERSID